MRTKLRILATASMAFALAGSAPAGFSQGTQTPVAEVTSSQDTIAINYPEGKTIGVRFRGTSRLPKAGGEAKVERKKGMTEIEVELNELKPATLFGGDYNTYVLWTVSPEGQANNIGELVLKGNRSKLNVSTPMETFGMIVTAEPHFLVRTPSRFIVLENTRPTDKLRSPLQTARINYRGSEGVYRFDRETLMNQPEAKGEVRVELREARTAVQLAERAEGARYAPDAFERARDALKKAEANANVGADRRMLATLGHEAVRLAVAAQNLAEERANQAAVEAERAAQARKTAQLEQAAQEAEKESLVRERRALAEARQRIEAEAKAQQAEAKAQQAEEKARQAEQQTQQLAAAKSQAEMAAERARRESEDARAQMREAFSRVVETRQTARGLILNLPDILFDSGKATLRPQAREVLSKVAGILLVAGGYRLQIEGHTDNVGNADYNLKLSERRALSVRDYLAQAGLSPDLMTTRGFGETQPIASNERPAERQKNRRVEIVVEELKEFRYKP